MKKVDFMGILGWIAVGVIFCINAIELGLGDLNDPGPGFFPFLMSVIIILFSVISSISLLKKRAESNSTEVAISWPELGGWKRILLTVSSLFLYIFGLEYIGFKLITFLFVFLQLKLIIPQKWLTCLLGAGLATLMSYGIFQLWLKVQMPVGFLEF